MNYCRSILLSFVSFSLYCISAFAQDPVTLSPQYYKVLIDNDEVRLVEFHLTPGAKEPTHSHARGFVYALEDAKLRITFPDGRSEDISVKAGESRWRDKITHAVENIGTTQARTLAVELKK